MELYFIRHGEAEERGHGIPGEDAARKLVRRGIKETRIVAEALEALKVRPVLILSSPLVRARETAEVLAKHIRHAPQPVEVAVLAPGGRWCDVRKAVEQHLSRAKIRAKDVPCAFLVGHQPDMGRLILEACAGVRGALDVSKSACVGLAWKSGAMDEGVARICLALEPDRAARITRA